MRLASVFSAALTLTAVSALAVLKPHASTEAWTEAYVERRQVGGGFSRSCSDYRIYKAADGDWYIEGTCRNNAGGQTKSGLNLNICLANIKSVLKWQLKFVAAFPFTDICTYIHFSEADTPGLPAVANSRVRVEISESRALGRS